MDAWGGSWGGSWGLTWTTGGAPPVTPVTPGPGYRYAVDELQRVPKRKSNRDKDVDIALAMLLLEDD